MQRVALNLHMRHLYKFILLWLLGAIFESVLCSPLDVHRIVIRGHGRSNRDRDNYRYHSDHRQAPKHVAHESSEDTWPSETQAAAHHYQNSYRTHRKNESNNGQKRGKPRDYIAAKPFGIGSVEFTTTYPGKPIPIIETAFHHYNHPNNSLDLGGTGAYKLEQNFEGKVRQHRDKQTPKNLTKGYEVYEEIIGDVSPPPPPSLRLKKIKNTTILPVTTPVPVVTVKDEENHIKENVSNSTEEIKPYGRRTKPRRNRGQTKFE